MMRRAGREDDLVLRFERPEDSFYARVTEADPAVTTALQPRLRVFVEEELGQRARELISLIDGPR
jgi:hypothetical protein